MQYADVNFGNKYNNGWTFQKFITINGEFQHLLIYIQTLVRIVTIAEELCSF